MKFNVTDIDFDFTDDCGSISEEHKKEIYDDVLGEWEAIDEEDLLDEISSCTGWCIKSIDYRNILTGEIAGWA